VGSYSNPNSNHGAHAFSYSNGSYTSLGTLPGGSYSSANAINNAGTIVGYSTIANGDNHAFSYSNGNMTDLGTVAGFSNSVANGINSAGAVVGFASDTTSTGYSPDNHAFVYIDGALIDLNSALSRAIGTTLADAFAINDSGQIVAEGSNGHAYLLSPY
jgi:probable HAF family extracellular repeat protein